MTVVRARALCFPSYDVGFARVVDWFEVVGQRKARATLAAFTAMTAEE